MDQISTLLLSRTLKAKVELKLLCVFVCCQVRDGAMSDLQTQLREVLRENELLRREVSNQYRFMLGLKSRNPAKNTLQDINKQKHTSHKKAIMLFVVDFF